MLVTLEISKQNNISYDPKDGTSFEPMTSTIDNRLGITGRQRDTVILVFVLSSSLSRCLLDNDTYRAITFCDHTI